MSGAITGAVDTTTAPPGPPSRGPRPPHSRGSRQVRDRLRAAVIICAILLAVGWSRVTLSASRQAAADAASDLCACRNAAARIDRLRGRPAVAGSRDVHMTELSRRIEEAAREAGMRDGGLDQIEPEPPRQVGESPYRQTSTRVRLQHATLQQLFTFLHALAADETSGPGLRLQTLRLSTSRGEETGDTWTAEATLTYLVYDPNLVPSVPTIQGPVALAMKGK
jgi:hypothetical protein